MKFRLERKGILIIPESEQDVAFIEDTLGLERHGDSICLKREDSMGIVECLRAEKERHKRERE